MSCVQEYWRFGLRDADGNLSVPGREQAGDVSQHFPAQRELHRGGAAAAGPGRPVLHPDAAPQTTTVSPHLLRFSLTVVLLMLSKKKRHKREQGGTHCPFISKLIFILFTKNNAFSNQNSYVMSSLYVRF